MKKKKRSKFVIAQQIESNIFISSALGVHAKQLQKDTFIARCHSQTKTLANISSIRVEFAYCKSFENWNLRQKIKFDDVFAIRWCSLSKQSLHLREMLNDSIHFNDAVNLSFKQEIALISRGNPFTQNIHDLYINFC